MAEPKKRTLVKKRTTDSTVKKKLKPADIKKAEIKINEDETPIGIFRKKLQFMLRDKHNINLPLPQIKDLADDVADVIIGFLAEGNGQYINLGTEEKIRLRLKPINARLHVNLGGRETAAVGERNTIVAQNIQVGGYLKSIGISREEFREINGHDDYEFTPVTDPEVLKGYDMTPDQNLDNWVIIKEQIEGYDEADSD